MGKQEYESPQLSVLNIDAQDVVTASPTFNDGIAVEWDWGDLT